MDWKGFEERVKVYLRVFGDESLEQYEKCMETLSRQCVRFREPQQRRSFAPIGAFPTRDKLSHTPLRRDSTRSNAEEPQLSPHAVEHNFDYVFDPTDSLEFIHHYVCIDTTKRTFFLSIGRGDALGALAETYCAELLHKGVEVTAACALYSGEKCTTFADKVSISQLETTQTLLREAEMGQGSKPRDGICVLTLSHSSGVVQFAEATAASKLLDLLLVASSNSDMVSDLRQLMKHRLFSVLIKTVSCDSRIIVLGNVVPSMPHHSTATWVLKALATVMNSKQKCVTFQMLRLLKRAAKLETEGEKNRKAIKDFSSRSDDAIQSLTKEKAELSAQIQHDAALHASVVRDLETQCKRQIQELSDLRAKLTSREAELSATRSKVIELETDLANRDNGITTQYQFLSGFPPEEYERCENENKALRAKVGDLEMMVAALQKCLGRKGPPDTEPPCEVAGKRLPRLNLEKVAAFSVLYRGERTDDQLHLATEEIARLQALVRFRPPTNEPAACDFSQSRALYHLLTEMWIYADSAVRGLKQQFDRMFAAMELKVAERELRVAQLEIKLQCAVGVEMTTKAQGLETELCEARAKCSAAEAALRELRELVRSENDRLREDHRKRMNQYQAQVSELTESVKRLKEEVSARESDLREGRTAWERERRELQEQVADLKEARKPLTASKRK